MWRRMANLLCALVVSECLLGSARPSLAETPLCTWGGAGTLSSALESWKDLPSEVGGPDAKDRRVRHSTLRSLFVLEGCPKAAEETLEDDRGAAERWIAAVPATLKPYIPQPLTVQRVGEFARRIRCGPETPLLCKSRDQLRALSKLSPKPARRSTLRRHACAVLGPTLMEEGVEDFRTSDGGFIVATSDLAFLLTACPGSFSPTCTGTRRTFKRGYATPKGSSSGVIPSTGVC